jgi:hypothetical protein
MCIVIIFMLQVEDVRIIVRYTLLGSESAAGTAAPVPAPVETMLTVLPFSRLVTDRKADGSNAIGPSAGTVEVHDPAAYLLINVRDASSSEEASESLTLPLLPLSAATVALAFSFPRRGGHPAGPGFARAGEGLRLKVEVQVEYATEPGSEAASSALQTLPASDSSAPGATSTYIRR